MLRTVEFEISELAPTTTHQAKKIVRHGAYHSLADTPELIAAKRFWAEKMRPYIPDIPLTAPVRLSVAVVWPFRCSDPKYITEAHELVPCTVTPDCSNVVKTIEDQLVKLGFIENDQGNSSLIVNKYWGSDPYVYISLEELDSPFRHRKVRK